MKRLVTTIAVSAALMIPGSASLALADPPNPTPGTFCSADMAGKTAKATDGTSYTCTAGADGKNRWAGSTSPDTVTPGTFCGADLDGKSAKSKDGTAYTCAKGSDGKDRWTKS